MDNQTPQPGKARFEPLSLEQVASFPAQILLGMADHLAKSRDEGDNLRARAMIGALPRTASGTAHKQALGTVLRCATDEEAVGWIEEAIATGEIAPAATEDGRELRLGRGDFGAEATLALRKGKPLAARLLAREAAGANTLLALAKPDGQRWLADLASQALLSGEIELFSQKFESLPMVSKINWAFSDNSDMGKELRQTENAQAQAKAWERYAKVFDGSMGEALARQAMALVANNDGVLIPLAFSPHAAVREEFLALGGMEAARQWMGPRKAEPSRVQWLQWVAQSQDKRLIDFAFEGVDMRALSRGANEAHTNQPLALRLAGWGGKMALEAMLAAAIRQEGGAKDLARHLLSETHGVWVSADGRSRKKGDALARCVALGNQDAARMILGMFPDISTSSARTLVNFCAKRGNEIHGMATATWEYLLLGQMGKGPVEPGCLVAEEPEARRPSRRL